MRTADEIGLLNPTGTGFEVSRQLRSQDTDRLRDPSLQGRDQTPGANEIARFTCPWLIGLISHIW